MRVHQKRTGRATRRMTVAALVVALLPGCMTITMRREPDMGPRVYGGTLMDLAGLTAPIMVPIAAPEYLPWVGVAFTLALVDLPFSLAADTILLPITIPEQIALNRKTGFLAAGAVGDMEYVTELITARPELAQEHYWNKSALSIAAATGQPEFAALLLEHGADVNAIGEWGETALDCAIDPRSASSAVDPLLGDDADNLPADEHYLDVARLLLQHGADPNGGRNGDSPMVEAVRRGKIDFVRLMADNGGDINVLYAVGRAYGPNSSPSGAYLDIGEFLIERGADVNAHDPWGFTALHRAAFNGHREIAGFLIQHRADVNARSNDGATPLMDATRRARAASDQKTDLVRLLVDNGADVHARDDTGRTALHWAASHGHPERARLLIEHGADVNARTNEGATPLQRATRYQHHRVAELLRAHGGRE